MKRYDREGHRWVNPYTRKRYRRAERVRGHWWPRLVN